MPKPPIKPVPYPAKPWWKLAIDILGELHAVVNHARYIIVHLDLHSKWPEGAPVGTITTQSVPTFLSNLFAIWGIPDERMSDKGRQFVSKDVDLFCAHLAIKQCNTALYNQKQMEQSSVSTDSSRRTPELSKQMAVHLMMRFDQSFQITPQDTSQQQVFHDQS